MKKLFLTALMALGFLSTAFAQEITFTIVKTNGTTAGYVMSSDSKIYYSDTQIFIKSNGETVSYDLSGLRKADRKSTRLNSSHIATSRMPSSA